MAEITRTRSRISSAPPSLHGVSLSIEINSRFHMGVPLRQAHPCQAGKGQDVRQGVLQHLGRLGEMFLQLDDHPSSFRRLSQQTVLSARHIRPMAEAKPHLVLLDLALPGVDGIDLMVEIAGVTDAPAIFLSAYTREENVIRAMDMETADYVVKPFSPMELAARTRAELRKRRVPESPDLFVLGDLAVYFADRRVTLAGDPVPLTYIQ